MVEKFELERLIFLGDIHGHTVILGERTTSIQFSTTIADERVTWVRDTSESVIDYIMINKNAREMIIDLKKDEEGDINIPTNHESFSNELWR